MGHNSKNLMPLIFIFSLKTCHTKPKRQVFCLNANTILEI
jgi:hypothetical protein